jgi:hypothetical protein
MGKTLFPDKEGIQNSPNGNIIVIVNKNLSPAGALPGALDTSLIYCTDEFVNSYLSVLINNR